MIPDTEYHELPIDICPLDLPVLRRTLYQWPLPPQTRISPSESNPSTWQEHVQALPPWKKALMRHVSIKEPLDVHLLTDSTLYIVTDGGAMQREKGSFGWVIATDDTIIVEGHGPVWGSPVDSFRAEAVSLLSVTAFLHEYTSFYDVHTTCSFVSFTDNLGLIRRLELLLRSDITSPRWTTATDFDVLQELVLLRQQYPFIPVPTHVKGHQDRNADPTTLPWPAQLNVAADHLATYALHRDWTVPKYPTLPSCKAYLLKNKTIITSAEKQTLSLEIPTSEFFEYLRGRLPDDIDDFSWPTYRSMRRRQTYEGKIFTTKLLTGWLPTGRRMHLVNERTDADCPHCHQCETTDHWLTCQYQKSWHKHFYLALERHLTTTRTPPDLQKTILQECDLSQLSSPLPSQFRGLIPNRWILASSPTQIQQQSWAIALNNFLIHELHAAWKTRNQLLHQTDEGDATLRITTANRIRYIYSHLESLPSTLRELITSKTCETRINESTQHMTTWFHWIKPLLSPLLPSLDSNSTTQTADDSSSVASTLENIEDLMSSLVISPTINMTSIEHDLTQLMDQLHIAPSLPY